MSQNSFNRAAAVLALLLVASPLAVTSPLSASRPAVRPGEILDLPPCEGLETEGRNVLSDTPRRMMRALNAFGFGSTLEETKFTEKLGNVIVKINRAEAPKGTTRFQLRYFIGNYDKSGDGPYHARFFKNESLRVRIPDAKLDTYYFFQVAALRRDCILYTGGIITWFPSADGTSTGNVWCSEELVTVRLQRGVITKRCPTAPAMKYEQE